MQGTSRDGINDIYSHENAAILDDTGTPSTVQSTTVSASPLGVFSRMALDFLRNKAQIKKTPLICTLLIDEIKLSDKHPKESYPSKKPMVFVSMVVSIIEDWRIPMGYYQTTNDQTCVHMWISDVLNRLHENSVKVISMTTNAINKHIGFPLGKKLHANLEKSDTTFTSSFNHPSDGSPVYIMYDIPGLIDELKSLWAVSRSLTDGCKRKIDCHTVFRAKSMNLDELETYGEEAFYDWVIIKKRIQFEKRMLSKVVADAVQYLLDLDHPEFIHSEGTILFLRLFDNIYNFAMIKDVLGIEREEPLGSSNEFKWKSMIFQSLDYLKQLKVSNNLNEEHPFSNVLTGLIVSLSAIIKIYYTYVSEGTQLQYLLPYKFALDNFKIFDRESIQKQSNCSTSLTLFLEQIKSNIASVKQI